MPTLTIRWLQEHRRRKLMLTVMVDQAMVDRAVADPVVPMAPRIWRVAVAMGPVAMMAMVALIPPRAPMADPATAKLALPMADLAAAKLPTVDVAMEGMAMVALNLAMVALNLDMVEAMVAVMVVEQGMATMAMVGAKEWLLMLDIMTGAMEV